MDPIAEGRRNWIAHGCGPVDQVTAATALTRGQQLATRRMAALLAEHDLTFARLEVLVVLADHDAPLGMGQLGDVLHLHPTTAARTVARLERVNFVERIPDVADRRVTRVLLRPLGLTVTRAALRGLREIRYGLDGWGMPEARRFTALVAPILGT